MVSEAFFCNIRYVNSLAYTCMLPEIAVWYVHLQFQKYKQKVGLDKANCSSLSPAAPSPGSLYLFLHFTDVVSEFADVFFLLFKGI